MELKYVRIIGEIVAAAILTALVALAFGKTYEHGYHVAEVIGETKLANYKASIAQGSAQAASDAFGRYANDIARGQAAEAGYLASRESGNTTATALKEQIDHVSQPYVPPAAKRAAAHAEVAEAPVDRCVFSTGFVRLWNAAAGIADDSAGALQDGTATGSASNGSAADAATDSRVSQADVLDWFVDYANRTRGLEDELKGVRAAWPGQQ